MSTTLSDTLEYSTLRPSRWRAPLNFVILLPILLATVVTLYYSLYSIAFRITRPYALGPWESEIVMDGYRVMHGMPAYEWQSSGHATHMYGPLVTYTVAPLIGMTSPNFFVARAVQLTAGLCFTVLLIWAFARRRVLEIFVAAGLVLALHYRCRAYFTETRPEVSGLLLATLGLLVLYRAEEWRRRVLYLPGTLLILAAMFYKQTYAAAAGVPFVAVLLRRPPDYFKRLIASLAPVLAVAGVVLFMKFVTPILFYYMVRIGTLYEIKRQRVYLAITGLATLCPFFYAMAVRYSLDRRRTASSDAKFTWLAAAIAVGIVVSIPTFAKRGGTYNSMMPAFAPMTAFCIAGLGWLFDRLTDPQIGFVPRILASGFAGVTIITTALTVPKSDFWAGPGAHGDRTYRDAVRAARKLDGTVICFDDPTIALRAKGYVGRCLEVELDASGRPGDASGLIIPAGVVAEVSKADWVIRVHSNYDGYVSDKQMQNWGFKPVKVVKQKSCYAFWKRVHQPTTMPDS